MEKKRFVVVGLGNFGHTLAAKLHEQGHEVVAVDIDEEAVDRIAPYVNSAAVGDGRQIETLKRLGAEKADVGIVSTGDDITASILATMALKDLKVEEIFVKVISINHARVMDKIGVTESIFPERKSALRLATRIASKGILNYIRMGTSLSIQELAVPTSLDRPLAPRAGAAAEVPDLGDRRPRHAPRRDDRRSPTPTRR